MKPIVFLHIPKTAGQTIHNELARMVGKRAVSPIRVHSQVGPGEPQMPAGYGLYSGHLDWTEIDTLPEDKFIFTVLRDPGERIASFYFYLLKEAQRLTEDELALPHNTGKKKIRNMSADDYFFGGDGAWQTFIHDHYNNFYCTYFATRKMRGYPEVRDLPHDELIARAQKGLKAVDRVYSTSDLVALEQDIDKIFGKKIRVAGNYHNTGGHDQGELRWPKLLERFESDDSVLRLEQFVTEDELLMDSLDFARSR